LKNIQRLLLSFIIVSSLLNAEYLENTQIPKDTKSDWMELKSGEWVRGEFKGMYSGEIEFDSDKFDLVKFDIEDVKQISTVGNSTINLNRDMPNLTDILKLSTLNSGDNELTGNLKFEDNKFIIKLQDGTIKILSTNNIASISAGELKESNYWSASFFLGVDLLSGNTEQVTITGKASAERRTSLTRFRADYLSTYTEVDSSVTTADNNRLTGSFDLYQTNHFYWRLVSFEYIRDPFKNIGAKYTLGVGLGYDILYTDTIDWSVTLGASYQHTDYSDVQANENATVSSGLMFLDTRYKQEITSNIDFLINYNMHLLDEESGRYVHHVETSLETEIINDFTVGISLFWDRVELPVAFADGAVPGKDDFKTMLAIGYSY